MLKHVCFAVAVALAFVVGSVGAGAAERPLNVVMYSGSAEYDSAGSLAKFKKLLEEKHGARCTVHVVEEKGSKLNGIEGLESADVAVFYTRRVSLAPDQLAKVKAFVEAGKGMVGIRTASHGFQTWLEFDGQVIGGAYGGHYKTDKPAKVSLGAAGKDHPALAGVEAFETMGKLYKNPKVAADATVLLRAKSAEAEEPVAWARAREGVHGRVFYTSLGVPADFDNPQFQRLLANAVRWVAKEGR